MAHDIFPFVNVFVVTNILTRNYHEFLYFFSLSQYILQSMYFKNKLENYNYFLETFVLFNFYKLNFIKQVYQIFFEIQF